MRPELHRAQVEGAVGRVEEVRVGVEVADGAGERFEVPGDRQNTADTGRALGAANIFAELLAVRACAPGLEEGRVQDVADGALRGTDVVLSPPLPGPLMPADAMHMDQPPGSVPLEP